MTDIAPGTVGDGFEAGGNHESLGKDGGLVRATVPVSVFQNKDFVLRVLSGLNLGIDGAPDHPQSAAGIKADLNGLDDPVGFGGKKTGRKSFGQSERCQFGGRGVEISGLAEGGWTEAESQCGGRERTDRNRAIHGLRSASRVC